MYSESMNCHVDMKEEIGMKNCWKLMAWLMVLGLMAVGIYRPVLADSSETSTENPVTSKSDCSITMTIDSTGTATGGSFLAYRVAEIVSDDGYVFKSLYGDITVDFSDATKKTKLINEYYDNYISKGKDYIVEEPIKATADKGVLSFTGLKTGLYLIDQETAVSGYTNLDRTLVSVPYQNSDGTFKYNVVAISKSTITTSKSPSENNNDSSEDESNFDDDSETEESEESDSSSSSTESKKLPQTGQLWCPLPLLLCGGLLLMFVGRRIRK